MDLVCDVSIKESHELLLSVPPVHVESAETAIFAADCIRTL